jgi:hypothetical protein
VPQSAISLSRVVLGIAVMALPPVIACATNADGEIPDGGFADVGGGSKKGDGGSDAIAGDENGCMPDAECCGSAQCPPTAHVQTTACTNGGCVISTCAQGWYDFDAAYATGCNCLGSDNPTSCATAMAVPSLSLGMSTTLSGNLPTESGESWFHVIFTGTATSKAYHPKITFVTNPRHEFVFDVASSCGGDILSCADRDAAVGLTTWEEFYGTAEGGADPDATTFKPIAPVGAKGVVYVRVYRADASGPSCDGYVLGVSD